MIENDLAKAPCTHAGHELRREECPACSGNVQVKIFACAVRGECTLRKALPGIACCATCDQFESEAD